MYRSFLALLPIDWIVLGIVMSKSGFPQCQNPTYVYDHVQTLSPMADFGPSALRYSYHPGDIPGVLSAYTWLRALRFLRLDKTLIWASTVKIPGVVEPVSRLLKILIITLVFAHLDSCAYWFLSMWIEDPRKWVKDYLILHDEENLLTPWFERYIKGLFASEKAMYFIMREVRTTTETIFQVFEMLLAAVLFGSIFGQLAVIVRLFDSQAGHDKAAKHRNYKREFLRRYMQEHAFPPVLQMKILNQEAFEWFHRRGMDTDNLFVERSEMRSTTTCTTNSFRASQFSRSTRPRHSKTNFASAFRKSTSTATFIFAKRATQEQKCTLFEKGSSISWPRTSPRSLFRWVLAHSLARLRSLKTCDALRLQRRLWMPSSVCSKRDILMQSFSSIRTWSKSSRSKWPVATRQTGCASKQKSRQSNARPNARIGSESVHDATARRLSRSVAASE
ncbi:hypothetical protein BC828DRAFT_140988 [Blastocladiella britannica]|nr:hypothetical protein BC828DRAFT_140988 [Blastocladiella britannica]